MNKSEFTDRVLAAEGRLYRVAQGMRNTQDRDDAVQEAVIKAWRNLTRGTANGRPPGSLWLIKD